MYPASPRGESKRLWLPQEKQFPNQKTKRGIKQESSTPVFCLRFFSNLPLWVLGFSQQGPQDLKNCFSPAALSVLAKYLSIEEKGDLLEVYLTTDFCFSLPVGMAHKTPYPGVNEFSHVQHTLHMWCCTWKHPVHLLFLQQNLTGNVTLVLVLC